ncbi:MAG: hypothetical protein JRJ82_24300, partial [Deltaproteobacteria bacterium]|nr:hypothetical protein [Deltaproteobacteria bacterium]
WLSNSFVEGTDRVWAFASPDENVAVRVRAFKHDPHADIFMVISLFESEIFGGGQRLALLDHTLNGIPGKLGAYQGVYNGNQVGVGAFYTVQNGNAYIIWSMIPTHLFNARSAEADAVINTFTITSSQVPPGSGNHPGYQGMRITNVRMGDHLIGTYGLASVKYHFGPSTPEIFLVFNWSGDVGNSPFLIKWTYTKTGYLIDQITLTLPKAPKGHAKSSLTIPNKGWPSGNYSAEIIHNSQSLKKVSFSIGGTAH